MNLKGHLLPHNILLKDVEKYYPPKKETNEVIKSLKETTWALVEGETFPRKI